MGVSCQGGCGQWGKNGRCKDTPVPTVQAGTTQQQARLEQHCGPSLTSRSLSLSSSSAAALRLLLPPAVHSWSESSASEPAAAFLLRLPAAASTQHLSPAHFGTQRYMQTRKQMKPTFATMHTAAVHSLAHLQTWAFCWSSEPAQCDTAMYLGWRPTRYGALSASELCRVLVCLQRRFPQETHLGCCGSLGLVLGLLHVALLVCLLQCLPSLLHHGAQLCRQTAAVHARHELCIACQHASKPLWLAKLCLVLSCCWLVTPHSSRGEQAGTLQLSGVAHLSSPHQGCPP